MARVSATGGLQESYPISADEVIVGDSSPLTVTVLVRPICGLASGGHPLAQSMLLNVGLAAPEDFGIKRSGLN